MCHGRGLDGLRGTEDLERRLDAVDADVHEGTCCHVRIEDVHMLARFELLDARRHLREAEGRKAHLAGLFRSGLEVGCTRAERVPCCFESDKALLMGKFEDLFGELPVCSKRLLDEHVLAAGKECLCLLSVKHIRRADIDSVYLIACTELLERGERKMCSMCLGEGAGILFLARIRCHIFRFRHLCERIEEALRDR